MGRNTLKWAALSVDRFQAKPLWEMSVHKVDQQRILKWLKFAAMFLVDLSWRTSLSL